MSANPSLKLYRVSGRSVSGLTPDATAVYEIITGEREPLDLGETWPALHVLLTHGEPPMPRHIALEQDLDWDDTSAENILMGGEATPYEDALTVARYLAPVIVRSLVPLITDPKPDEFDDYLLDYLPEGWSIDRARDELCTQAARLRAWYQATASAGDGLLLYVA